MEEDFIQPENDCFSDGCWQRESLTKPCGDDPPGRCLEFKLRLTAPACLFHVTPDFSRTAASSQTSAFSQSPDCHSEEQAEA
jgi:hypothetical protein